MQTTYGWTWQAGFGTMVDPRSLLNWPMQANGAEMMRMACCPVHDALLVERDTEDIDNVIAAIRAAMECASELVLGARRIVETDVDVVRHPNRYADEAGVEIWDRVTARLNVRGL
jgi:hypothetical protein